MKPRGSFVRWVRRLARNIRHGDAADADLRADVSSYVELLTDEKIAAGMPPEAARRAALMEFGSVEAVKEETRAVRAGALLGQLWQDTRYAFRIIRRELTFSVVAVLTLALGIGANTAIFSVVNGVLLEPLSYADSDRLVVVWERNTAIGKDRDLVAPLNFQDWQKQNSAFDDLGAFRLAGFALTNVDDPEQLRALAMSSSVFRALRANPLIGRAFTDDEERRRDRVVVLAYDLWQRRFGGDRTVVGRSITLNANAFTVVGVMPASFGFPDGNPVDVYTPLVFRDDELNGRRSHTLSVIGRLKSTATPRSAQADLGTIAQRIAAADRTSNPQVTIVGAHDVLVEDVRLGLLILLGTVGFVLLIACANVANLLLVRGASRRREIAIRAALGAGRQRLIRQLLTESVLLAGIGALAGLLMAWWLLRMLVRFGPSDLPRIDQVGIDAPVLLFVTAVALITGIAFGIAPSLRASKPRVTEATKESGYSTTAPFGRASGRSALLIIEIALSLMLLAGAGLMVRSLLKLQSVSLGFQPTGALTARILLSPTRYPIDATQYGPVATESTFVPDSKRFAFFAQLEDRLNAVREVESVGAVSALPLDPAGTDYDLPVVIQGKPRPRAGEEPQADFRIATASYFRTMRIPVLRGRAFTDFDGPNSTSVVIINDTMAREMFAGDDPLGRRLILYGRPREIVGIVGSVRHRGFSREARPEMVVPARQMQFGAMTIVVRSSVDRSTLSAVIAKAVQSIDPAQPVFGYRTTEELLADSVAQPRFTTLLLGGFAALALLLAVVGVYGVMSYSVAQRIREIGVRIALGADRPRVVWMVVRQGMGLAMIGVVLGIAGAAAGTRVMAGLLFGVTTTDPAAFLAAAAILALTCLGATCVPALRAAHVAPVTILKAE